MTTKTWNCPFCKVEIPSDALECPACHRSFSAKPITGGGSPQRVVVVDVDISISNMVMLILKFAAASIPAALVVGLILGMLAMALGLGAGLLSALVR